MESKTINLAKNQQVLKEWELFSFISYGCRIATYDSKTFRFVFYTNEKGDLYAFSSRTTAKYLWEFISWHTDATYNKKEQILKAIECKQIETKEGEGNDYTEEKFN